MAEPVTLPNPARLFDILRVYAERQGLTVAGPGHKLVVSDRIGFLPDITIYAEREISRGGSSAKYPIPMLVVEVQSQEIQDAYRNAPHKAMVYANLGVGSFWLLDPDAHVLLCYRPKTDGSSPRTEIHEAGVISPAGFEGLSIDLDWLWAEV
jgi:Uma2 family endonuclease